SLIGDLDLAGKGNVAPLAKRTSRAVAVAITGAPSLLNEIAPIQSVLSVVKFKGSGLNSIEKSAAAVLNTGASSFKKFLTGVASSPGGGLIAARSRRYSGTRTKTLRRKLVRVAAAALSPALVAASRAVTCSRTSAGQADERATIFATDDLSVAVS